ncbi:MAG: glycosyl hydrolase [Dactylosporangium sp.]|nr:glycoside hydrolase family 3 C-terminal domain-containing protein [Dactylosporangium sp.]NNJ59843.1 glycosyl hydrolase [Dactylosporangium sp.]
MSARRNQECSVNISEVAGTSGAPRRRLPRGIVVGTHTVQESARPIATGERLPWQDPTQPAESRVTDLLARMTIEEKIAQLSGAWVGAADGEEDVAPHQHDLSDAQLDWDSLIRDGLGQLTRPFGTAPIDPAEGMRALARMQLEVMGANRFGIPAQVHEECLAGFTTWHATIFPTPLAWGASFDAQLVERAARWIGTSMRSVGVHQGLSPVLDVVRDPRWGRTEESIGEDPYLVATIGAGYVRGLESAGVVATPKHFVGYSASRAGRNQAPVAAGPRELADVLIPPFEAALRHGGARSLMHSYAEVDGMPPAANEALLTGLLRDEWGFAGVVVADYFGVSFLELSHQVAGDQTTAAALALAAGVDVELPTVRCYGQPLTAAVRAGTVSEALIDRAVRRVLLQKCQLGLLDAGWRPEPVPAEPVDLDPPAARALARELAEASVVLLANDGTLPLRPATRVAVVGPLADDQDAMLGCYSFPRHIGSQFPELPLGVELSTVVEALRGEPTEMVIEHVEGCAVTGQDTSGFAEAVAAARRADVCIAVLGDRSGLFGRGTSGEGCDVEDLSLPGVQGALLDALLATSTPVVLTAVTGRPYALGGYAGRLAATVQAFFPGEEGGPAIAGVLTGRVCPSGRLPVSVPRTPGGQPATYLAPALGRQTKASSIDPSPLYPFGHGLSYTTFEWSAVRVDGRPVGAAATCSTDGALTIALTVRNTGDRAGTEVVQLYLHDPVAQVTRPVVRLIGYARVPLAAGQIGEVVFSVHAELTSFTGRSGARIVEPGAIELRLSTSSEQVQAVVPAVLVGAERVVGHDRHMVAAATVLTSPIAGR